MVEFTIGYLLNYNKFPDLFQFAYGNQKLPAICYYVVMKQRILAIVTDKSVQKFVAVGLISFAVDFGLLLISHYIFKLNLELATTLAYLTGLVVNFLLNKIWTFQAPTGAKQSTRQAVQYGLLVVVNLIFTNVVISSAQHFNIGPELSKPVATALIMVLNYVVYNRIIFRTEPPVEPFAG
jgi:putative flippase GtrA